MSDPGTVLILLHLLNGEVLYVNPRQVVSVGPPRVVSDKAECVLTFVDAKFVSVLDTCDEVRERLLTPEKGVPP